MKNNYQEEKKLTNSEDTKPESNSGDEKNDPKGSTDPKIEIVKPFNNLEGSSEKKLVFTEDPKPKPKDPEPEPTPEPIIEIIKPFKNK